jgi:predicted DNA-binding protein
MNEEKNYELELSEETAKKLEAVAQKTGRTEDEICQYIFFEFLEKQAKIIEKMAEDTGKPVNELLNMHFDKLLDYLATKEDF